MKMLVCAVYDDAVKAFNVPLFFRSKGEALRSFSDAVNDPKVGFNKHAGDYAMYVLGDFDDASGALVSLPQPEKLITGLECQVPG